VEYDPAINKEKWKANTDAHTDTHIIAVFINQKVSHAKT
jgi:hypothetical protein